MLDRALYQLRRGASALVPVLGSWQLSVVLMVAMALYFLLLAIWSTSTPAHVVQSIAGLAPFLMVYLLLLVNTGWCLWNRLPRLRRDPGLFLFHGAFFLLALGFGLTILGRREATVWVAEGEVFAATAEQILSVNDGFPPTYHQFKVNSIVPEFWQDQMLFTRLEAEIILADGDVRVTRINRPLWLDWNTFVRLSGFGYTPRYEILTGDNQVIDSAFVKMNIFPPGQRDHFRSSMFPHRVYLEMFPDYIDVGGAPNTRTLNLVNPAYSVAIYRGKVSLGGSLLQGDDVFDFEGLQVRFPEVRYWGQFSVVCDPGAPVLLFAGLMAIVGLIIGLALRRRSPSEAVGSATLFRPGGGLP